MGSSAWGAVLGSAATIIVAVLVLMGQRMLAKVETAKVKVAESTATVDAQRVKLEGFSDLVASLQAEARRKDEIIAARDAQIERLLAQRSQHE